MHPELAAPSNLGKFNNTLKLRNAQGKVARANEVADTVAAWSGMNGKQGGDQAKLPNPLVKLGGLDKPPARFVAGADAISAAEAKADTSSTQANAYREVSSSLDQAA